MTQSSAQNNLPVFKWSI